MPWEPLGEWGRLGDDLGKLSPPTTLSQFLFDLYQTFDSTFKEES